MQGVIKSYDPSTGEGTVVRDVDRSEYDLAPGALEGSIFRMLRQGQRVVFELDDQQRAIALRTGAEPDLGMPNVQL
jgi:CspA family cold shock protein